jgi:hypothetical protein
MNKLLDLWRALRARLVANWKHLLMLLALVLALVFGYVEYLAKQSQDLKLLELLAANTELHTQVTVVSNKNQTAVKAIEQLSDENTQLIELVARLKHQANRPPVIKEVVVTKTVLQPQTPQITTPELPPEYRFKLEPGLEVARFSAQATDYTFTTHKLTIKNSIVIGESQSAAMLQIASSAEPDKFYEFPIDDLRVSATTPQQKLFAPHLMLGIRAGLSADPQLTAQAIVMLLHPRPCVDTLGLVVAGNNQTAQFGVSPLAYNLGCHLPVVDDLWITTDAYVDIRAQFGAGLGIASKF